MGEFECTKRWPVCEIEARQMARASDVRTDAQIELCGVIGESEFVPGE
jgi:hypothetical protein